MRSESKVLVKEMIDDEIILTDKPTLVEAIISGSYYQGVEEALKGTKEINLKATIDLLKVAESYLKVIKNNQCVSIQEVRSKLEHELYK